MPPSAAPDAPSCVICRLPLADAPSIPTTSGEAVHIRCAERAAHTATRRRAIRAAVSAMVLLVIGVWGMGTELRTEGGGLGAVLMGMVLIAVHIGINRRWWYYTVQSARLRWRLGR